MLISPYLVGRHFDPELKRVLGIAFELVCVTLGRIGDSDEHVRRSIVLKVIELAAAGERNPDILCELALAEIRGREAA